MFKSMSGLEQKLYFYLGEKDRRLKKTLWKE